MGVPLRLSSAAAGKSPRCIYCISRDCGQGTRWAALHSLSNVACSGRTAAAPPAQSIVFMLTSCTLCLHRVLSSSFPFPLLFSSGLTALFLNPNIPLLQHVGDFQHLLSERRCHFLPTSQHCCQHLHREASEQGLARCWLQPRVTTPKEQREQKPFGASTLNFPSLLPAPSTGGIVLSQQVTADTPQVLHCDATTLGCTANTFSPPDAFGLIQGAAAGSEPGGLADTVLKKKRRGEMVEKCPLRSLG